MARVVREYTDRTRAVAKARSVIVFLTVCMMFLSRVVVIIHPVIFAKKYTPSKKRAPGVFNS